MKKRPSKGNASKRPDGGAEARTRHAVVQRTLERFPWARLAPDAGGDQIELRSLLESAGEEGRRWFVRTTDGDRLPGPLDVDVYVALGQLYNESIPYERRGTDRTVWTTLGELTALMGRERGGMTYKLVAGALLRLASVRITAVQTWREGDTVGTVEDFALLANVKFGMRRDGDEARTAVRVRFSEELAASIAAGQFRLLDTARYFALPTPTAKRLFRYLDVRRYRGPERLYDLRFPLRQLAEELPIDQEAPSHIKRTLAPAHEALIASGYLTSADFEAQHLPGKRRPVWVAHYTFPREAPALPPGLAELAPVPPAPRRAETDDPEELARCVSDLLAVLRDERSHAFYLKCAKTLPHDMLRGIVGDLKDSLRTGSVSLESARKMFTAAAKARARSMGLDL